MTYPNDPGWKGDLSTGIAAASDAKHSAKNLRAACVEALGGGNYTADEMAAYLQKDILAIRPRFSELRNMGMIEDTGDRRKNKSGKNAAVWRLRA